MRGRWIAALAFFIAGCAPMQWVKPDATPEQLAADMQQCEQAAWQEASYRFLGYRPFGPWLYRGDPFFYHPVGPYGPPGSFNHFTQHGGFQLGGPGAPTGP